MSDLLLFSIASCANRLDALIDELVIFFGTDMIPDDLIAEFGIDKKENVFTGLKEIVTTGDTDRTTFDANGLLGSISKEDWDVAVSIRKSPAFVPHERERGGVLLIAGTDGEFEKMQCVESTINIMDGKVMKGLFDLAVEEIRFHKSRLNALDSLVSGE